MFLGLGLWVLYKGNIYTLYVSAHTPVTFVLVCRSKVHWNIKVNGLSNSTQHLFMVGNSLIRVQLASMS